MQTVSFETSLGPIPLWGRFDSFSDKRPLLFVIRGLAPQRDHLVSLADRLSHADVALAHLPGMHSPLLRQSGAASFARAFDEVLAALNRSVVVMGVSFGGTVALALRSRLVRELIVLDPPLSTDGLGPLRQSLVQSAHGRPAALDWLREVAGLSEDQSYGLDFRPLVAGLNVPCTALIGSAAGLSDRLPSLLSEAERQWLAAQPAIALRTVDGAGHNIPRDGLSAMMGALREVLVAAA